MKEISNLSANKRMYAFQRLEISYQMERKERQRERLREIIISVSGHGTFGVAMISR